MRETETHTDTNRHTQTHTDTQKKGNRHLYFKYNGSWGLGVLPMRPLVNCARFMHDVSYDFVPVCNLSSDSFVAQRCQCVPTCMYSKSVLCAGRIPDLFLVLSASHVHNNFSFMCVAVCWKLLYHKPSITDHLHRSITLYRSLYLGPKRSLIQYHCNEF